MCAYALNRCQLDGKCEQTSPSSLWQMTQCEVGEGDLYLKKTYLLKLEQVEAKYLNRLYHLQESV